MKKKRKARSSSVPTQKRKKSKSIGKKSQKVNQRKFIDLSKNLKVVAGRLVKKSFTGPTKPFKYKIY
jgi:hypothetical protein